MARISLGGRDPRVRDERNNGGSSGHEAWPAVLLVTVEEGLDVLTLLASLGEHRRCVACVAERDGLTRRAPQPRFDHGSSSSPSKGSRCVGDGCGGKEAVELLESISDLVSDATRPVLPGHILRVNFSLHI